MARDDPDHAQRVHHRRERVQNLRESAVSNVLEMALEGRQEFDIVLRLHVSLLELRKLVVEAGQQRAARRVGAEPLEHHHHAARVRSVELLVEGRDRRGARTPKLNLRQWTFPHWLLAHLCLDGHRDVGRPVLEGRLELLHETLIFGRCVDAVLVDRDRRDRQAHISRHLLDGVLHLRAKLLQVGHELDIVLMGLDVLGVRHVLLIVAQEGQVHLMQKLLELHHRATSKHTIVDLARNLLGHARRVARAVGDWARRLGDHGEVHEPAHARGGRHVCMCNVHVDLQQLGRVLPRLRLRRRRRRWGGLLGGRRGLLGGCSLCRRRRLATLSWRRSLATLCGRCRLATLATLGRRRSLALCGGLGGGRLGLGLRLGRRLFAVARQLAAVHEPREARLHLRRGEDNGGRRAHAVVGEKGFEQLLISRALGEHVFEGAVCRTQALDHDPLEP